MYVLFAFAIAIVVAVAFVLFMLPVPTCRALSSMFSLLSLSHLLSYYLCRQFEEYELNIYVVSLLSVFAFVS